MRSTIQIVGLMSAMLLADCQAAAVAADASSEGTKQPTNCYSHAKLRPIGFQHVTIDDGFFRQIRDRSRDVGTADYLQKFEDHDYINFFRWVTADPPTRQNYGPNNNEFVYKLLEAMGIYAAESDPIARLHDNLSTTIQTAQADDGYLNTFYQNPVIVAEGKRRFQTENRFEFYNFGHYTQAAIAHYRATGDRKLLDSAIRFADLIVDRFADPADLPYRKWKAVVNQKYEHPDHELAMVELYRATGDQDYLDFVRQTYEEYEFFGPKFEEIWGHAVQESLLYAGATDLYLETGAQDVWITVNRLWHDMSDRKRFITGGVGSQPAGESYGAAYYLPHENCYQETCAGISLFFWNHKMLLATGNTVHADEMDRSVYNNVLGGISLDGTHYFYQQKLRCDPSHGDVHGRSAFHGCPCCPPNVHRLFAAIGDYIYTHTDDSLQVNLFINSTVERQVGQQTLKLIQESHYPHDGTIKLTIAGVSDAETTIALRIPAWAENAVVKVNDIGQPDPIAGGYLKLKRGWNTGDTIQLDLSLAPRIVRPNPKVAAQQGRLAMMVGPLVYCVEQADNPTLSLRQISVADDLAPKMTVAEELLGGVNVLKFPAVQWTRDGASRAVTVNAIPYYAWANRELGYMNVWLSTDKQLAIHPPKPGPPPRAVPPITTTKPAKR